MAAKIIQLSEEITDITPKEVMQMESFKHFTEEQAKELLAVFDTFCEIAYNIWSSKEENVQPQIIPLIPTRQRKAA